MSRGEDILQDVSLRTYPQDVSLGEDTHIHGTREDNHSDSAHGQEDKDGGMDGDEEEEEDGSNDDKDDDPAYPNKLTISSTGGAAKERHDVLGTYRITSSIHNRCPVWQNAAREDRYLFYSRKYFRWVIQSEVSDDTDQALMVSNSQSIKRWDSWQYAVDGGNWRDDTLNVNVSEVDHADDEDDDPIGIK